MIGEITEIFNNKITVLKANDVNYKNIINKYVKIYSDTSFFVGEIIGINKTNIFINLLGEIRNNKFISGVNTKPDFDSCVELMTEDEIKILFNSSSTSSKGSLYLGKSVVYNNLNIFANINSLFANHLVVLGNTGSGKSCAMARILQNIFYKTDCSPTNATFFIIDAYGEYASAFSMIDGVNKDLCYKNYISDFRDASSDYIKIPLWLLSLDDICILLGVTKSTQIPIVEKALKLVNAFKKETINKEETINSIVASSLLDILINGKSAAQIRDQIFSVLSRYNTPSLNLESPVFVPGYTRPLKQCLIIDDTGKIREMELVINFLESFIKDKIEMELPDGSYQYNLSDLLYAFDFALIDEGILNNEDIYGLSHELRVRIASILEGEYNNFFNLNHYYTKEEFINFLVTKGDKKAQIINLNINNVDDRFAKIIAKIYAKLLFDYAKNDIERASMPIHIILEEAHRYVQNDHDVDILGYNIFERIAKEGRKYGVLLDLISQRPSELSQTVLSQCNNFIIFKITHPADLNYIKSVVPYIEEDMIDKIKSLQTGTCLCFGNAVKLPILTKLDLASPSPSSSSPNIEEIWYR